MIGSLFKPQNLQTIITCMMPLLLLAAVLAYKLQMSLNKQKKLKKVSQKKESELKSKVLGSKEERETFAEVEGITKK